jgi:hypothetical protein
VPEIVPSVAPRLKPGGRAGLIDQVVTAPPVLVGVIGVIGISVVYPNTVLGYATAGFVSFTVNVRVVETLPPWFAAVIVYAPTALDFAGVPVIAPVVGFRLNPWGNAGVTVQVEALPVTAGINGAIG